MKVIDKDNNIVEDICPSCGKDGATIQTTEYADGSQYIEVMCLNGCGHFARIIKRESEPTDKQMDNEEWFDTLSTKEKAKWLDKVAENCCQICDEENRELCRGNIATGCKFENAEKWELWLKQPHRKEQYR